MEILSKLSESGINILDLVEYLPKIKQALPIAKKFLNTAKEYEKTFNLKEGQKVVYSIAISEGEEKTAFVYVWVIEQTNEGSVIVAEEKFSFDVFEKLNEVISFIPGA